MRGRLVRGFPLRALPFCVRQPFPDGGLFLWGVPACLGLGLLLLTLAAVVDDPIDHLVVILHGHLCGAEGILRLHRQGDDLSVQADKLFWLLEVFHLLLRHVRGQCGERLLTQAHHQDGHFLHGVMLLALLIVDSEGAGTVAHDELLSIVRLMVQAVPSRLRLLSVHIRHIEDATGGPYCFTGLQVIRGGLRDLAGQLRLIFLSGLLYKGRYLTYMGFVRVLDSLLDHRRGHVEKFLISGGAFEVLQPLGETVLGPPAPYRSPVLRKGNPVLKEFVRHFQFFILGQFLFILKGHHPVLFRDAASLTIIHNILAVWAGAVISSYIGTTCFSSSFALYHSVPPDVETSFTPQLLLSPQNSVLRAPLFAVQVMAHQGSVVAVDGGRGVI